MARPQRSVIPAAQKVTPRNTERSPLRINQSQPTVSASATASAVQENSGTWPGSSFAKLRAMVGGNPVIIANQPNHMSAPSRPELMAPNHASALAAPRRKQRQRVDLARIAQKQQHRKADGDRRDQHASARLDCAAASFPKRP